jgi:hypothetical protein
MGLLSRLHAAVLVGFIFVAVPWTAAGQSAGLDRQSGKRMALVIGNNKYTALPESRQLQKAVNDARAVGATLQEIGFIVTKLENASRTETSLAIGALEAKITPGDTVFLFFAGHGIDIAGTNYLLPSDFPAPQQNGKTLPTRALKDASFNAADVLAGFQDRGARTVLAVFDACREPVVDDEGRRALGLARGGLAEMKPAAGIFIMFSAGAKQLALDRLPDESDANSVFTRTLVPLLKEPGLSLVAMAKKLQPRVQELAGKIGHQQTPAYYDQIVGDFYLVAAPVGGALERAADRGPAPVPIDPCASAETHWKSAEGIGTKAALQDHANQYSHCRFAGLARERIRALDACVDAERDWRSATSAGTRAALEAHIDRFGECAFAGQARARLAALPTPSDNNSIDRRPAPSDEPARRGIQSDDNSRRPGSYWDHNGSVVYLSASGAARKFLYDAPREGMQAAGARKGSVLFEGRRAGNRYSGTAYVFASGCGSFAYAVSGDVLNGDRQVVMSGQAPRVDRETCKIVGYRSDRLVFDYKFKVD